MSPCEGGEKGEEEGVREEGERIVSVGLLVNCEGEVWCLFSIVR